MFLRENITLNMREIGYGHARAQQHLQTVVAGSAHHGGSAFTPLKLSWHAILCMLACVRACVRGGGGCGGVCACGVV